MSDCPGLNIELDSDDDGMLLLEDAFSTPEQQRPAAGHEEIDLQEEEPQREQPVLVWNHKDQCKKLGPESNCKKASKKGAAKQRARPKPSESLPPQRTPAEVDSDLRQMVASKGKGVAKQL